MPITIVEPASLDPDNRRGVRALAAAIEAADGAPPLSDQGLSRLGSDQVRHFLAVESVDTVGYAQLDASSAEVLAAGPLALGPLLDAVESAAGDVEVWAHGSRSRLLAALERRGYQRGRVLWQLRWPVRQLAPPTLPDGVRLRRFVPGHDEGAWLAVNSAAFAHHAEQGSWTMADIVSREAEPWFDPNGFLLAERASELVGFHWTKMHSATLGEVYVLGVSPQAQGLHLGSALLVAGLNHLRERGATEVMLYVDESNTTAMGLYERYGFHRTDHDVQYHRPSHRCGEPADRVVNRR